MKRLAYIVSRFPSTTETFIAREMRALEELGCAVEVFALVREHRVVVHQEAAPFVPRLRTAPLWERETWRAQVHWLRRRPRVYLSAWWQATRGCWRSPSFLLRAWIVVPMAARFAREAQDANIEHVHAHWATHPALAAYVVRRLTEIPFSFTAHAHDIFVDRTMLEQKVKAASFVAVISEFNRALLVREYGDVARRKTAIVRCGIDPDRFAATRRVRSAGDPFTILCVASLQAYKGHRVLIDALALLRDEGVAFECVLIGEGEERSAIETQIGRLGLRDRVRLEGARRSDEVVKTLQDADVVALASVVLADGKMEGIPVALMEALACEVPVVASRISGIPELVIEGQTGLTFDADDHEGLARQLARLARDGELRTRLGAAGRAHVAAEFSERMNAARLHALFAGASPESVRTAQLGLEEERGRLHDELEV